MRFFVRTGLIFISEALSVPQMFPIAFDYSARGQRIRARNKVELNSPRAAPFSPSHPSPTHRMHHVAQSSLKN